MAGTSAFCVRLFWMTRSEKCTALMWRSLPRSYRSNRMNPRDTSRPSSRSLRAFTTFLSTSAWYLCTLAFHETPRAACLAALWRAFRSATASRSHPALRSAFLRPLAASRRALRAFRLSSEFIPFTDAIIDA